MATPLHRPGLIVHTFFAAADQHTDSLSALWAGLKALDIIDPMAGRPHELPTRGLAPSYTDSVSVLAGLQRVRSGELHQAIAYQLHDVIGLSVLQAPNDDATTWEDLRGRWDAVAAGELSGVLGTAVIQTGLWPQRGLTVRFRPSVKPAVLGRHLAVALGVRDPGWKDRWVRTEDGIFAWELPGSDRAPGTRQVLAVTHSLNEPALDRWTWARPDLPPLTRYLMHAAKICYQDAVLTNHLPALRGSVAATEHGCKHLNDLLRADVPSGSLVESAGQTLSTVQTAQAGLIAALSDVRGMAATVQASHRNMRHLVSDSVQGEPGGLIDVDDRVAARLLEQLTIEETYLDAAHRRADDVGRLAAGVLDHRHRTRQEGLTLLQASVLGGLLMTLAAIQSLQYEVPLPGPLVAPLILTLGALAVLLPSAVLRSRRQRDVETDHLNTVSASILGAGIGWLAATAGWEVADGRGAPSHWAVVSAVASALLVATVAVGRHRRRTMPPAPPTLTE